MSLYSRFVRPALFRLDAETAHALAIEGCRFAGRVPFGPSLAARRFATPKMPELTCEVAGLRFDHPIGLAAGWDKSGRALRTLEALGFGFAEIGSVSAEPSRGNPRPRLFRLPRDRAIVVNYGLPNDGAAAVAGRIGGYRRRIPLGINVVTTNRGPDALPDDEATVLADYASSVALLHRHADYLMLNLSCPNAEGGKDLFADPGVVRRLLTNLGSSGIDCPVFLKIAPTSDDATIDRLLDAVDPFAFVRGFSFNLPPGKPPAAKLTTPESLWRDWPGAVSGRPVSDLIDVCVRSLYRRLLHRRLPKDRYAIVASGGVFTGDDAYRKIRLGASLVQIYTALVYEGPGVTRRIALRLRDLLVRDGFAGVADAVGVDADMDADTDAEMPMNATSPALLRSRP